MLRCRCHIVLSVSCFFCVLFDTGLRFFDFMIVCFRQNLLYLLHLLMPVRNSRSSYSYSRADRSRCNSCNNRFFHPRFHQELRFRYLFLNSPKFLKQIHENRNRCSCPQDNSLFLQFGDLFSDLFSRIIQTALYSIYAAV